MFNTITAATASLAAALTAALALGSAGAAQADSIGTKDPADIRHGVDLRSVQVAHGEKNLRIVLTHKNLRRDHASGASGTVYIDTDPNDKGPELAFVAGLYQGTDYRLLNVEGFGKTKDGTPVDGFYIMRLDYDREQTRIRISRDALGDVDKVRAAVKVGGYRADGSTVTDWLKEPRSFTPWVERG